MGYMMKRNDITIMKAVALCFKPFLKPEEAMIYCNLGRTQLSKKCEEYGIFKNQSGYYSREELDKMLSGKTSPIEEQANQLKFRFRKK